MSTEQTAPGGPTPKDLDDQLDQLLTELSGMDEDKRLRRVHELIDSLATGRDELGQQRFRNAITGAGYIGRGDWRSAWAAAKQRHAAAVKAELRDADCPYYPRAGCLYAPTSDGGELLLARFVPEVVSEVTRDDGAEVYTVLRIRVTLPTGRVAEVNVPADRLHQARRWSAQAVGAAAVITPMSRDEAHVSTAAQYLGAGDCSSETVYAHTGWRATPAGYQFLTASGALGAAGLDRAVTVDLGNDRLNGYALPDPGSVDLAELQDAVRASLALQEVAPGTVTVPMLGAVYRAPLPLLPETSLYVVGPTGSLKTALSAVMCQHYGRLLDAKALPAEWKSTANALEATAYQLAGVLFVIDDYAPQAAEDPRRLAAAADRVFRGAANSSGRGRMRPDQTMRPLKPPRAQVLSTGEDVPPGESLRARLTITTVDARAIDPGELAIAQQRAAAGVYDLAMAGYVRWLADRQDTDPGYMETVRQQIAARRAELTAGSGHLRVPEAAAGLLTGWRQWLEYAVAIGALSTRTAKAAMAKAVTAMRQVSADQAAYATAMRVAEVYLVALAAALTGGNAHLADLQTGQAPLADPASWGWESYRSGGEECWRSRGTRVGWVSRVGEVYLDADSAYEVARSHAGKAAQPLATTKVTIHKRLREGGYLVSTDAGQLTVVRTVAGKRRRVLHVHAAHLTGSVD